MKRALLLGMCLLMIMPVSGFRLDPDEDRKEKEKSQRGWLGVSIQDVTSKIAKRENLKSEEGAYISDVLEESPAQSAGLERGDVVIEFNGRAIYDSDDLSKAVGRTAPGTKANVVILRKGEKKTVQVTLAKMPKSESFAFAFPRMKKPIMKMFHAGRSHGLEVRELNKQLGEYFGAPEGDGVLVEEVESKSAAEKGGFKAGDVILKVGKRAIYDVSDVWRAFDSYRDEGKADVEVLRKGSRKTLTMELSADDEVEGGAWHEFGPGHREFRHFEYEMPEIDLHVPNPDILIDRQLDKIRRIRALPGIVKSLKSI